MFKMQVHASVTAAAGYLRLVSMLADQETSERNPAQRLHDLVGGKRGLRQGGRWAEAALLSRSPSSAR